VNGITKNAPRLTWIWVWFVAIETFAQISLKFAATGTGDKSQLVDWLATLASNGWFQASIAADVINFFVWMSILRRHELSLAVPLSSFCYFTIVAFSTLVLHETVSPLQLLGLAVVGAGIILVAGPDRDDGKVITNSSIPIARTNQLDNAETDKEETVPDGSP
jgi:drug/metabolite transporter (DMT)-like permease